MTRLFTTAAFVLIFLASHSQKRTPAPNTSRPVQAKLVSLTAESRNGALYVNWKAENEMNVNRYEVQRFNSAENNYATIGIAFAANSDAPMDYAFKVPGTAAGKAKYRVIWLENDGAVSGKELEINF